MPKLATPISHLIGHHHPDLSKRSTQHRQGPFFGLSRIIDLVCINLKVFIYSVKINVALKSITSWETSTLTGHRSCYINRFHPHFFHDSTLLPSSSGHFLSQWNWWLLFSLEQFQTPHSPDCQSRDSYSLLLGFSVSLVSISCSFFSSRAGDTTSHLQFENYCACHLRGS